MVQGLGIRLQGSESKSRVQSLGLRDEGLGFVVSSPSIHSKSNCLQS